MLSSLLKIFVQLSKGGTAISFCPVVGFPSVFGRTRLSGITTVKLGELDLEETGEHSRQLEGELEEELEDELEDELNKA